MKQTLIIFDWDDTLLPTTWIQSQGLMDPTTTLTEEVQQILAPISESVLAVLRQAQMHGFVIIVTNAAVGWVEHSCGRFLPACQELIDMIPIVSARSSYELHTESQLHWKMAAFRAEVGQATNVLSIGDSDYERQAAATLVTMGRTVKSLKLEEKPSPDKLKSQLIMIVKLLDGLVLHTANMDIVCSYLVETPVDDLYA